ncbi:MAG: hypothetical protein OXU61_12225 [Gammaproteobacteria bacterium]|nr:hypothetical protein [Gammaproteobacteria bacterium]
MAPAGDGASLWLSAAPSSRHEGARSARFIRWIPAPVQARGKLCAGMARWGRRNGGVDFIRWMPAGFLHELFRWNDTARGPNDITRKRPAPCYHGWRRGRARGTGTDHEYVHAHCDIGAGRRAGRRLRLACLAMDGGKAKGGPRRREGGRADGYVARARIPHRRIGSEAANDGGERAPAGGRHRSA